MSEFFEGRVEEALERSKAEDKLLIVVIEDETENSTRLSRTWTNPSVASRLRNDCIALRLQYGSSSAQQFSQVYYVPLVPTVYVISPRNGKPLHVAIQKLSSEEFLTLFNKWNTHKKTRIVNDVEKRDDMKSERKENKKREVNEMKSERKENKKREVNDMKSERKEKKREVNEMNSERKEKKREVNDIRSEETLNEEQDVREEEVRIAIRFPDGHVSRGVFKKEDTISFVMNSLCTDSSRWQLTQHFPRSPIQPEDYVLSLSELGLCPSALLVAEDGPLMSTQQTVEEKRSLWTVLKSWLGWLDPRKLWRIDQYEPQHETRGRERSEPVMYDGGNSTVFVDYKEEEDQ